MKIKSIIQHPRKKEGNYITLLHQGIPQALTTLMHSADFIVVNNKVLKSRGLMLGTYTSAREIETIATHNFMSITTVPVTSKVAERFNVITTRYSHD